MKKTLVFLVVVMLTIAACMGSVAGVAEGSGTLFLPKFVMIDDAGNGAVYDRMAIDELIDLDRGDQVGFAIQKEAGDGTWISYDRAIARYLYNDRANFLYLTGCVHPSVSFEVQMTIGQKHMIWVQIGGEEYGYRRSDDPQQQWYPYTGRVPPTFSASQWFPFGVQATSGEVQVTAVSYGTLIGDDVHREWILTFPMEDLLASPTGQLTAETEGATWTVRLPAQGGAASASVPSGEVGAGQGAAPAGTSQEAYVSCPDCDGGKNLAICSQCNGTQKQLVVGTVMYIRCLCTQSDFPGYEYCWTCVGKGTIRNPDYVAPRQDTGGTTAGAPGAGVDSSSRYVWQDCQFCDGGKKTCTSCNGSGKLPLKGNTYSVSDQCRECRGTGRSMCLYCGGQGGKQVREP